MGLYTGFLNDVMLLLYLRATQTTQIELEMPIKLCSKSNRFCILLTSFILISKVFLF